MQGAALTVVGNIVLDFTPQKLVFMQTDGIAQLTNLSQSMDHTLRRNAVLALKNLLFMADVTVKRRVMAELTVSTLCDLIRGKLCSLSVLIILSVLFTRVARVDQ